MQIVRSLTILATYCCSWVIYDAYRFWTTARVHWTVQSRK